MKSFKEHTLTEMKQRQYSVRVEPSSAKKAKWIAQDFRNEGGSYTQEGRNGFLLANKEKAQALVYMFMMDNIQIKSITEITIDYGDHSYRKITPKDLMDL